ncbi:MULTISPECIES: hypothetical protein [Salinibaculum]|uniref:hypothetical protein n=1 Tax=Salinibaculum TaxID=2732368 RepID=UPI0030CC3775
MSVTEQGDGWTVEVTDGVMIWEFLVEMDLESFREDAFPVFKRIVASRDVTGMVTVEDLDDLFNDSVFQVREHIAQRAAQKGVDRWVAVSDGIKKLSLSSKIDTRSLDTFTTENRTEAIECCGSAPKADITFNPY